MLGTLLALNESKMMELTDDENLDSSRRQRSELQKSKRPHLLVESRTSYVGVKGGSLKPKVAPRRVPRQKLQGLPCVQAHARSVDDQAGKEPCPEDNQLPKERASKKSERC